MVGVVAAAAELVPALGAAEVHAAASGQSVLELALRTGCEKTPHTVNVCIPNRGEVSCNKVHYQVVYLYTALR